MKLTNRYGVVAGGYIFDTLDRLALQEIEGYYGDLYYAYLTAKATIWYKRRVYPKTKCVFGTYVERGWLRRNRFYVWAEFREAETGKLAGRAKFVFVGKRYIPRGK